MWRRHCEILEINIKYTITMTIYIKTVLIYIYFYMSRLELKQIV